MRVGAKVGVAKLGLLLCVVAILAVPSAASAQAGFCSLGSGSGKCEKPEGLAVDRETGHLYIADRGNNRIDVFESNGTFLFAFGWGVADGATNALQSCTATCFKGIAGAGAGQFSGPSFVAVDNGAGSPSHHDIYVGEQPNRRVQKFDPEGHFLLTFGKGVNAGTSGKPNLCTKAGPPGDVCGAGSAGSGAGEFNSIRGVGVTATGSVEVFDTSEVKECELAGIGGYEFTKRLQKFTDSGEPSAQLLLGDAPCGQVSAFTVDSTGDFYVANEGGSRAIRRYHPDGTPYGAPYPLDPGETTALGVDGADDLFAAEREVRAPPEPGDYRIIAEYAPGGAQLRRFGYGRMHLSATGLAPFHSADGEVFTSEEIGSESAEDIEYIPLPPPGPVASPLSLKATPGNVKATLKAEINPEGKASEYRFDYVDQKSFQTEGGFAGPKVKSTPLESFGSGGAFKLQGVSAVAGCTNPAVEAAEGKCLVPETTYRFRLVASNADGSGNTPLEGSSFKTEPPTRFDAIWSSEVGPDSATVNAEIDPLGLPTSGYFEYVDDATYQESGFAEATEVPDVSAGQAAIDFGSGEKDLTRSAYLSPLAPATTYHYRLAAADLLVNEPLHSPERTLRTFAPSTSTSCPANEAFRAGPAALLPDCRAFEMVSPLEKDGADIVPGHHGTTDAQPALDQSSLSGEKLAYGTLHPFGDAESGPFISQYIAARDPKVGWRSHSINPPKTTLVLPVQEAIDTEFKAFSPDLCSAWLRSVSEPVLAEGAVEGFSNLYRRSDSECGEMGYEALTTAQPPNAPGNKYSALELQGLSADGEAAIYVANDNLTADAPPQPNECVAEGKECEPRLYESIAPGQAPRLICILPSGEAAASPCSTGAPVKAVLGDSRRVNVQNAFSDDGQRVVWTASGNGPGSIYLRINTDKEQSALSHITATGKLSEGSSTVASLTVAKGKGNPVKEPPSISSLTTSLGQWEAGQTIAGVGIPSGTTIVSCSPSCGPAATALTLSKAPSSGSGVAISSSGPMPFAPGQEITGTGIPPETKIAAAAAGSLTLSRNATESKAGVVLSVATGCTEAEKACTISVSGEAEELSKMSGSRFWTASGDGTKAIFTTESAGASDLYEFDAETEATTLIARGAPGVAGASDDASRVYFVSSEALAGSGQNSEGDKAVAAKPNLYLYEAGVGSRFIATLSVADAKANLLKGQISAVAQGAYARTTRVSADGLHLAFMSTASPTGYDNTDLASGQADAEVYLYDAGSEKLICASCNPSGARPAGASFGTTDYWAAAHIPGWENSLYAARVLSSDGRRLFFEAVDSLAGADTNGVADVYEWEAPGSGDCDEASPAYSPANEGCVALISSGKSARAAEFVDASPSGDDVFFSSKEQFVPADSDDLVDVYDARVGGGFPAADSPPAQCEGEACQSPPEVPNDPPPASSSFEGAGNVVEEAPAKPAPCAKGKVRRHGKCVSKHRKKAHKRAKRHGRAAR